MVSTKLTEGNLFDIQGFSVHDGPGCRTLIFLKGCSLNCSWCSNPEGLNKFPEPLYNSSKCIFDKLCVVACEKQAITIMDQELKINKDFCRECVSYECTKACCAGALKLGGYKISVDDLLKIVQRDRHYWGSDGGITLTGGEPFLQADFVKTLLQACHKSYIHTAVETCGNIPWSNIQPSLEYLDWIFFDLKHMESVNHEMMTGSGNRLILENARRLASGFTGRLVFRMPVVPGFNDDDKHILQISDFMNSIGKDEINILPLHHLGREKYNLLGESYYTKTFSSPSKDSLFHIQSVFTDQKIKCYIGTETPF
jgi:pyruvate formate lyase activating enzyme